LDIKEILERKLDRKLFLGQEAEHLGNVPLLRLQILLFQLQQQMRLLFKCCR